MEREANGCSHGFFTSYMDGMPVSLNNVFADGQAQPRPGRITVTAFRGPVKSFEDAVQVFFRYANAIVADLDKNIVPVGIIHTGHYRAIVFAIFYGIVNKI